MPAPILQNPQLVRDGVVVLPFHEPLDPPLYSNYRAAMDEELNEMSCFAPGATRHVFGGFGALGTPCSFHNLFVRRMRVVSYYTVVGELETVLANSDGALEKIEILPGRLAKRYEGTSTTAEAWHRDTSPNALQGDHVFGGWLNFGPDTSTFSCIPGTQQPGQNTPPGGAGTGFSAFTKQQIAEGNFKDRKRRIVIPPGHLALFYENLIHEVYPVKTKRDHYRLFHAYRLTASTTMTPLVPDLQQKFDDQAIIPMKSGQQPPMRAAMHWNFARHRESFETFCRENLHPTLLSDQLCKATGVSYRVSSRYLPSLKELGLPLYAPYLPEERTLYWPHRLPVREESEEVVEASRELLRTIYGRLAYIEETPSLPSSSSNKRNRDGDGHDEGGGKHARVPVTSL